MKKFALLLLASMILSAVPAAAADLDNVSFSGYESLTDTAITDYRQTPDCIVSQKNGTNILCTTTSGVPGKFNVFDLDARKLIESYNLNEEATVWSHAVDSQGRVYLTTYNNCKMYRYTPALSKFEDLGSVAGESAGLAMAVDDQDNVYISTYKRAKLIKFDPKTGVFTDLGVVFPDAQYAKSMSYYKGSLYIGSKAPNTRLKKYDLSSGVFTEIALPDTNFKITSLYSSRVVRDYLISYTESDAGGKWLIYHIPENRWLPPVSGANGLYPSPEINGKCYFPAGGYIQEFDLESETVTQTDIKYNTGFRRGGAVMLKNDSYLPNLTFVHVFFDGTIAYLDPVTGKARGVKDALQSCPAVLRGLGYLEGKLYYSTYMSTIGVEYDVIQKSQNRFSSGQTEGIAVSDGKVYLGVYPGAKIHELDPSKPFDSTNPTLLKALSSDGQDRPFALEIFGDYLVAGTVADYNSVGGALSLYNRRTKQWTVKKNIIPNQSITGLAYRDGKIFLSSGIYGGLGIDPVEQSAKIAVYDIAQQKLTGTSSLKPPQTSQAITFIGDLEMGPDNLLWGVSSGALFALNPGTLELVKSKSYEPMIYGRQWRPFRIFFDNGYLYATIRNILYVVDPDTLEAKKVLPGSSENAPLTELVKGDDGYLYFIEETQQTVIKRIKVDYAMQASLTGSSTDENNKVFLQFANASNIESEIHIWKDGVLKKTGTAALSGDGTAEITALLDEVGDYEVSAVINGTETGKITLSRTAKIERLAEKSDLDSMTAAEKEKWEPYIITQEMETFEPDRIEFPESCLVKLDVKINGSYFTTVKTSWRITP